MANSQSLTAEKVAIVADRQKNCDSKRHSLDFCTLAGWCM